MLYVLLPRRQRYTNQCLFSPRQVSPTRWRQEREDRRKEITTYLSDLSSFLPLPPPPLLLSEQRKEALITLGREEEIDERVEEGGGKEREALLVTDCTLAACFHPLSLSFSRYCHLSPAHARMQYGAARPMSTVGPSLLSPPGFRVTPNHRLSARQDEEGNGRERRSHPPLPLHVCISH